MALAELQSKHEFYKIIFNCFPITGIQNRLFAQNIAIGRATSAARKQVLGRLEKNPKSKEINSCGVNRSQGWDGPQVDRAGPAAWPIFPMICPGFARAITALGVVFLI